MADQTPIVITRNANGVVFPTVGVTLTQLAFFRNDDPSQPHWPVFTDPNIVLPNQIAPNGATSNPVMPGRQLADNNVTLTQGQVATVNYRCQVPGHESESGIIQVVNDFFAPSIQVSGKVGTVLSQQLTQGGMPPIQSKQTDGKLPKGVTLNLADTQNGASLTGTPLEAGTFTFTIHTADALDNAVDATFILTVSA
ncbi:MAG: hypothetical protein JNL98_22155 [Bryobacterales bacterium]|nr:hypothetical protein [Bryobacterales bacterium]